MSYKDIMIKYFDLEEQQYFHSGLYEKKDFNNVIQSWEGDNNNLKPTVSLINKKAGAITIGGDPNVKFHMLVIDDEEACINCVYMFTLGTNIDFASAYNGQEGLNYLYNNLNKVDIILLDLMMPDMHGLEVLKQIKNTPIIAEIPVVIHTGTADVREIKEAIQFGAVSWIRKPYGKAKFLNVINEILNAGASKGAV